MASAQNLVVNLIARTQSFEKGMSRSRKKMSNFAKAAEGINRRLKKFARIAKYGAGIFLTLSVKSFAVFEEQMANVSTMLDKNTMRYMPAFTRGIKRMSVEFGESTASLSKGLYDILSASIAPADALKVLAVSAKAAKAGLSETAIAADVITTILNSYQMQAGQAAYVSDILFATVKRGKLTFAELAENIGKVAALASVAGLSFEEVSAAIATMTRAGLKADLATTSLRGIITAFLKPTDDAREAAAELGLELSSQTLKAIGLTGALRLLKGISADYLAKIVPRVRAMAGFAAALGQIEGNALDLNMMMNAGGKTTEAYGKITDTLMHSLKQLKQAGILAAVSLGEVLAPAIKRLTAWLLKANVWTQDLKKSWIWFKDNWRAVLVAIQNYSTIVFENIWKKFKLLIDLSVSYAKQQIPSIGEVLWGMFKKTGKWTSPYPTAGIAKTLTAGERTFFGYEGHERTSRFGSGKQDVQTKLLQVLEKIEANTREGGLM